MPRKLISIGIDPGTVNGSIAIIDSDLNILDALYIPCCKVYNKSKQNKKKLNKETMRYEKTYRGFNWVDFKQIGDILRPYLGNDIIYTVEKVRSRDGEGEDSAFRFGNALGVIQGHFSLLEPVQYLEPTPVEWKTLLGVTSDKSTSIELAKQIFKDSIKKITTKKSDIYEALLLAVYGLMQYQKKIEE